MIISHIKTSDLEYLKPSNLKHISLILGIGYGLLFDWLFKFIKSIWKCNQYLFGLGCKKYGSPHSDSFDFSRTPSITKHSKYFLNIYPCTLGTGYGCKNISLESSFNSKSTESLFRVPIIPSKNYSDFCNKLSKYFCSYLVKSWHLFSSLYLKMSFHIDHLKWCGIV